MKQWLHKKPMRPMQKPMPREMELPSGISNQAMLSMLESQGMQTAPRPASGGTPLDEAMRVKFERQFGLPMGDVRVHHNSDEPAKFGAGAYTYGTDVFIRPGQEKLLNHEMTHVAQQELGQVRPTGIEHGMAVNRSPVLEHSADMGTVPQMAGGATSPVVQCAEGDRTQEEINEKLRKLAQPPLPVAAAAEPAAAAAAAEPVVTEAEELEEPAAAAAAAAAAEPETQSTYHLIRKSVERNVTSEELSRLLSLKDYFGTVTQQSLVKHDAIRANVSEYSSLPAPDESDQDSSSTEIAKDICFRVQGREATRAIRGIIRSPIDIFSKLDFSKDLKVKIDPVYDFPSDEEYIYAMKSSYPSKGDIRLFSQGKQPQLRKNGSKYSTQYKDLARIISTGVKHDAEVLRTAFIHVYNYITGNAGTLNDPPFKDSFKAHYKSEKKRSSFVGNLTRAINIFAALFFLEAHYTRAYGDGGKNGRAALCHVINNPTEFQNVFGEKGMYTLARVGGNAMFDAFLGLDKAYNKLLLEEGKPLKGCGALPDVHLPPTCYSDSSSDESETTEDERMPDGDDKKDELDQTRPRKRRKMMPAPGVPFVPPKKRPRVLFSLLPAKKADSPTKGARAKKRSRQRNRHR